MPRAFIVYSSSPHVSYINDVLEVIESVLRSMDIDPYYLRDQIRGGELYPPVLQKMITQSDMGIVILDGLRPNVAFEYGLLIMRNIDIIPFKKSDAKYSIKSLFYNPAVGNLDTFFAFGDFLYKIKIIWIFIFISKEISYFQFFLSFALILLKSISNLCIHFLFHKFHNSIKHNWFCIKDKS